MSSRSGADKYACDTFELSEEYGYLGKCSFCGHTRYEHSVAQRKRDKHGRSGRSLSALRRSSTSSNRSNRSNRSSHSTSNRSLSTSNRSNSASNRSLSTSNRSHSTSNRSHSTSSRSLSTSRRRSSADSRRSSDRRSSDRRSSDRRLSRRRSSRSSSRRSSRRSSNSSQSSQSSEGSDGSSSYTDSEKGPPLVSAKSSGKKMNTSGNSSSSVSIAVQHLALFQAADAQERARTKHDTKSNSRSKSNSRRRKNSPRRRRKASGRLRGLRNESDSSEEEMPASPVGPTSSSSQQLGRDNSTSKNMDSLRRHTSGGGRSRRGDRRAKMKDTLHFKALEAGDTLRVKAGEAGDGMRAIGTKVKALRIGKSRSTDGDSTGASTRASGSSSTSSSDDATQALLRKHAKRGGVRKLHAGVLFSVDVGDAPLGVKIGDMSKTRSGQVGFVVELVALAGLARKAGVIVGDVLVAIGDQLITRRMVWNEALAVILAKQRPLRMTFFRAYSAKEQNRRALLAQQCTCESSRSSTRVVKINGVSGSVPTMVAANCPEHGTNGSSSSLRDGGGVVASKRNRRMSRMAQNAQNAVEAFGASVGVPKDTSWHLMEQIHRHRLYFLPELPTPMLWCDLCHLRILDEAFHCRQCDFDVCTKCLVPRLPSHPHATALSRAPKRRNLQRSKHKPTETKPRLVKSLHSKHPLTRVPVKDVAEEGKAMQHTCNVCDGVCKDRAYQCIKCDYDACDDCVTRAITPSPSQHMVKGLHRHPLSFHQADEARKDREAAAATGGGSESGRRGSALNVWRKRRFSTSSNGSTRSLRGHDHGGGGGADGNLLWCDKCSANIKDVTFRCGQCDFDVCDDCFYANAGDPITTYLGPS